MNWLFLPDGIEVPRIFFIEVIMSLFIQFIYMYLFIPVFVFFVVLLKACKIITHERFCEILFNKSIK